MGVCPQVDNYQNKFCPVCHVDNEVRTAVSTKVLKPAHV